MSKYVKVEEVDGVKQIVSEELPEVGYRFDDRSVSGYNRLAPGDLKEDGWLPMVQEIPEYDPETQLLQHSGYIIGDDQVTEIYTVIDKPIEPIIEGAE